MPPTTSVIAAPVSTPTTILSAASQSTPSPIPQNESPSSDTLTTVIAVSAGIGGFLVLLAIAACVVFRRRGTRPSRRAKFGHRHSISDTGSTSLLHPNPAWRADTSSSSDYYPFNHTNEMTSHNGSTDSLVTVMPSQDEKIIETSQKNLIHDVVQDFPPHKPILSPLSIPSRLPHTAAYPHPVASPSSPVSVDSASLYSQPSAASLHMGTPTPTPPPSSPRLLPPMVPQYAHIRTDKAEDLTRVDTRVIGKLLKKRAKQNDRKPARTTSRIERAGSIRPVVDEDDEDEDSLETVHRSNQITSGRGAIAASINRSAANEETNTGLRPAQSYL